MYGQLYPEIFQELLFFIQQQMGILIDNYVCH